MLVELDDVLERQTADRTALASLGTGDAGEVVAAGDEGCVTLGSVADFAGFVRCGSRASEWRAVGGSWDRCLLVRQMRLHSLVVVVVST